MNKRFPILIGSTFPLSLVRRRVVIEPQPIEALRQELKSRPFASFWGHRNTLAAAGALLGADLAPETERPAIALDAEGFLALGGTRHAEAWILSPEYAAGYRPAIGEEVVVEKIVGWQVLRMAWE